jgi:hypothetical protein
MGRVTDFGLASCTKGEGEVWGDRKSLSLPKGPKGLGLNTISHGPLTHLGEYVLHSEAGVVNPWPVGHASDQNHDGFITVGRARVTCRVNALITAEHCWGHLRF